MSGTVRRRPPGAARNEPEPMTDKPPFRLRDWLENAVLRGLISALLLLPYGWRVPLCGWVMSRLIAPIAGYRNRVRTNLAMIMPDLPSAEVERIAREVPDNVGRTLIEIYSGAEFIQRAAHLPLEGAGVPALEEAHRTGRPVLLITGHFGNYDASRAALIARGYRVGALYNPMKNAYFNDHYVRAISQIGTPLFSRGKKGLADMVRHLRSGGMLGLLIDQHMSHGAELTFFGHRALTALSAADLALKYNALVVPTYGIRQPDGLSFKVVVEAPIPHGPPEQMTQALNDSLEHLVRNHLGQWLWIHRRWK
jgi:KDO2-lipid IV(A) lauroyltransferase